MDIFDKCYEPSLAKQVREQGIYPYFHALQSRQDKEVVMEGKRRIMLGSNNYLGLTTQPEVIEAGVKALEKYGTGCSGSRFLNGTLQMHLELEEELAQFLNKEAAMTFSTGFQSNLGIISAIAKHGDYILNDKENHASIYDACRLSYAKTLSYRHNDMGELERILKQIEGKGGILIVTDGVFSMDGNAAPLDRICALAEKYDALVMVDECHSAGVLGETGRGITELYDLRGQVDILTGTLGKAFGGAVGGFTTGRREIIDMLRQRSRPYLFSNSLPPAVVGAGIETFKMLAESHELHDRLVANVEHFRAGMMAAGFDIKPTQSAICAVMLYDAKLSQEFAAKLQDEGVFVTGFYYPVVPKGQARIRVQVSAGHTIEQLDRCIAAFTKVGKELNVIK